MALPVVIPNTFANANASIPLSQLDNNFSTVAVAINGMANGAEALSNVNITGGSIANASLSNVSISSGNVTINVANVTTLDATNVEVTNIKAKDGTASATIADSTGVMTIASSVLTTADINGGTIDNAAIGATTPTTGAFTTVSASTSVTTPSVTNAGTLALSATGANVTTFSTNGSERMRIDSSGNLGLGVTPSAWWTGASVKAIQFGPASVLWNYSNYSYFGSNYYFDGSARKYIQSTYATEYSQQLGEHIWYTAPSGTAGNTITFTQAMTLDASGNLGVGTSSPTALSGFTSITLNANGGGNAILDIQKSGSLQARITGSTNQLDVAANVISFTTGSISGGTLAERMRIDSSGNVGIGTSSPGTKLDVYGSDPRIQSYNSSGPKNILLAGGTVGYTGTTTNHPLAFITNDTERMRIDTSGNVGIGVTPGAKLDVYNSAAAAANNEILRLRFTTSVTAGHSGDLNFTNPTGTVVGRISSVCQSATEVALAFGTYSSGIGERMRIDSSGNLLVGTTTAYTTAAVGQIASKTSSPQGYSHFVLGNGTQGYLYINVAGAYDWNNNASVLFIGRHTTTSRSINAAGSVNASGADYAEYMTKCGDFTVAKGDVVGINAEGKLTNVFADAISFAVKSTDPSYVGGDVWGSEDALGLSKPTDESTQEEKDAFDTALEIARQRVDRIAFAGQVPVNVIGATAGQYIIPVNDNGAIKGEAVSNPTFEQYQQAVGKVIAIESDGRARIIVKVA